MIRIFKMRKDEDERISEQLSRWLHPKDPSPEFESQLILKLKSEFSKIHSEKSDKRMDMEKIHRVIGLAVANEGFRKSLFEDAKSACRKLGFELSDLELAALKNLNQEAMREFAGELDERISKKSVFPGS